MHDGDEPRERRLAAAARNNAAWCDLVGRLHGITGWLDADAWASPVRTPEHYPDAVTLRRSVPAGPLLARLEATDGCSVKDSFADLDPVPWGFAPLFEAWWIHRPAGTTGGRSQRLTWEPLRDAAAFTAWEAAWRGDGDGPRVLLPALLQQDGVVVLGARSEGVLAGGAILSLGGGVVGLSNLFAPEEALVDAFAGAAAAAASLVPGLDVVGYEAGSHLEAAEEAGFLRLGPLVVWLRG